jgi:hypothetical protein
MSNSQQHYKSAQPTFSSPQDESYDHPGHHRHHNQYESYTIAPAALSEEGIANAKPPSCFTSADTGPPYTRTPNGFCQKDVSGGYGTASGYNIYQNTTTYDPLLASYGYGKEAVESFNTSTTGVHRSIVGYGSLVNYDPVQYMTVTPGYWRSQGKYMINF